MLKRALGASSDDTTPASKRAATPSTASASRGRVVLDVGGTRFVSSRSTLESSSTYFRSLLVRWADEVTEDDPIFIDADADAFQVLLSYMRSSTLLLPSKDYELCSRAILLAEFLGLEALLRTVKARAHANMHSGTDKDAAAAAAAFDEEAGGLQAAIDSGALPKRYFEQVEPPPERRVVKALQPVTGFTCGFYDDQLDGRMDDMMNDMCMLPVVSLAIVELLNGRTVVDAVIQPSDYGGAPRRMDSRDEDTHSNLMFASDYAKEVPWEHWILKPPAESRRMLPIPPGSVRGKWMKPALTQDDEGKSITITNGALAVDGEPRNVTWGESSVPENVAGRIHALYGSSTGSPVHIRTANDHYISITIPAVVGRGDSVEADIAFAAFGDECLEDGEVHTTFYVPMKTGDRISLMPANKVIFGEKTLASFVDGPHR